MDHSTLKYLLLLSFCIHLTTAVSHSLQYIYTGVTPGINLPEFAVVGLVDGQQIDYYDSYTQNLVPRNEWIKKVNVDDPDYWKRETLTQAGAQETFKSDMDTLMQRFNHTKGVHTVQLMYGCELHDDGTKRGYRQYGYDGEDFISLDLNTLSYTAAKPQAVISKQKLESTVSARLHKAYLMNECIEWLKKYVSYGRDTLERKVPPKVSLFQKDSSSPVVCHATGFYPKSVMIYWQKNGEDLYEDVDLRETLPNQDGTFQKRSILTVSPEELNRNQYTCVVQHSGQEKEMVLQVSDRRVMSDGGSVGVIVGVVVAVLLHVVIVGVGVFIWKKKQSGFKPVSGNPNAHNL